MGIRPDSFHEVQRGGIPKMAVTVGPVGHGGISTYCRELVIALSRRDDVEVVVVGAPSAIAEIEALRTEPLGDRITLRGPRMFEQLRVALLSIGLRRRGIDLVHGTRQVLPLFWSGASVLTFHDDYLLTRRSEYDLLKRCLLPPIFRRSVRRADVVAILTSSVAAEARALAGPDSILVETGAAMSTQMASAIPVRPQEFDPGQRFALVVGDAGPRKRVARLLDAWERIGSQQQLVVAGGQAAESGLMARIERSDRAQLVNTPTNGELSWLYRHCDLVVDASHAEGFGFPRVESAAFGASYVAIRDAGISDTESAWVAFLDDQLAAAARSGIRDEWSDGAVTSEPTVTWDDVARATVDAYRSALDVSGSARTGRIKR